MPSLINPYAFPPGTMLAVIQKLGLTSNLVQCLDAGDINSYGGTSQTWTDVSGEGNHVYRGTGSGSNSSDPTFNGSAGGQSAGEYFGYDGGDWFTLTAGSPPSWQSNLHKSGGTFTILQWAYVGNLTATAPDQAGFGCGDLQSSTEGRHSILFTNSGSTQNALSMTVAATAAIWNSKSTILVTNNAWQMVAVSCVVGTNPIRFAVNGTTDDVNSSSSGTPGTTDSLAPLVIGAIAADGYVKAINGCRIAAHCLWTRALSAAELVSVFNNSRQRFGL